MTQAIILHEAEMELWEAVVYTHRNDHIWIIAFAHCKRRPSYWLGRV